LIIFMLVSSYTVALARDITSRPQVLHGLLQKFGR
jgi:hypothetical protein